VTRVSERYVRLDAALADATDGGGLHATKQRWVETTLANGLVRPSAAWFVLRPGSHPQLRATLTAAVYLALADRGRRMLAAAISYETWFETHPEFLPSMLLFAGAYQHGERVDRYFVAVPGCTGETLPYTKVARAGRSIAPAQFNDVAVLPPGGAIARAEHRAVGEAASAGTSAAALVKMSSETVAASAPLDRTKLALFCRELGDELAAALPDAIARWMSATR
jgi:hypothetical protein